MFKSILIYIIFAFITQLVTYQIMKKIDKKEREKLKKWEDDYIEKLIDHRKKLESMPKISEKVVENDSSNN